MPAKKKTTVADVAEAAGVSKATASQALSGKGRVAPATRRRIIKEAEKLGYKLPSASSGLGGLRALAVVISLPGSSASSFLHFDYFMRLFNSATATALSAGYALAMVPDGEQGKPIEIHASGVLWTDPLKGDRTMDKVRQLGVPIVSIGREQPDGISPWIDNDHCAGTKTMLNHLEKAGAHKIALVGSKPESSYAADVISTYRQWCDTRDMPYTESLGADYSPEAGYKAALELLSSKDRPDAIYAFLDHLGAGALEAAAELGIKVPDDLLVAV